MVIHIASFPGPFENLVLGMSLIIQTTPSHKERWMVLLKGMFCLQFAILHCNYEASVPFRRPGIQAYVTRPFSSS